MNIIDILNRKLCKIREVDSSVDVPYTTEEIKLLSSMYALRALKITTNIPDDLCRTAWKESSLFDAIHEGKADSVYHALVFSALKNPALIPKIRSVFPEITIL